MEFIAEDCVFETPRGSHPWGTRMVGKAEVRKGFELALRRTSLRQVTGTSSVVTRCLGMDDHRRYRRQPVEVQAAT